MNDETKDDCLQELERINKEIETVRHEVEQEKKRLSRYQTVQADCRNTAPNSSVSKSETAGKNVDVSYGLSSCTNFTKTYSRARKYVVDNSKPRTDLEYDPLSNFSAGLRSYSSTAKEQKVKNGHGLKRARNAVLCDQKKPVRCQAQLSRSPSPEPLDDSNEDGELIIDIPPSPDKKRGRTQKHFDSVASKSLQDKVEELKEVKTAPILLDSPPASTVEENTVYSNSQGPSNLYENKECENIPVNGTIVDLTGCFKDLGSESQAAETAVETGPEPASSLATTDQHDQNCNNLVVEKEENKFQVELPQCELPDSVEKMNPLQPHHFSPKNSLFYKASAANSDSPCRQLAKQAQTKEQPAQNTMSNRWSSTKCVPSVVPHSQKTSSKMPGQVQGKAAVHHGPPETYLGLAEPASGSSHGWARHNSTASSLTNGAESASASTELLLVNSDNEEVILIDSGSDGEDELNYSEMDLSDSDPMEECYRIFMEANNEDKGHEEPHDVSVSML